MSGQRLVAEVCLYHGGHDTIKEASMRRGNDDSSEDHGSASAGWPAFLAGLFVGTGVALLFAPQSGSELRGVLRHYAAKTKDDVVQRGREAWDTAVESGKGYMKRGQETLQQQAGRSAREHVESAQDQMKEAGGEAAATFNESIHEATQKGQPA
jgi:gas vesicle protein